MISFLWPRDGCVAEQYGSNTKADRTNPVGGGNHAHRQNSRLRDNLRATMHLNDRHDVFAPHGALTSH